MSECRKILGGHAPPEILDSPSFGFGFGFDFGFAFGLGFGFIFTNKLEKSRTGSVTEITG